MSVEQGAIKDIERKLAAQGFIGTGNVDEPVVQLVLTWVTGGPNPCPICLGLEGTQYQIDEAPIDLQEESHNNCKCRLLFQSL
jgi:hypothetical protein